MFSHFWCDQRCQTRVEMGLKEPQREASCVVGEGPTETVQRFYSLFVRRSLVSLSDRETPSWTLLATEIAAHRTYLPLPQPTTPSANYSL